MKFTIRVSNPKTGAKLRSQLYEGTPLLAAQYAAAVVAVEHAQVDIEQEGTADASVATPALLLRLGGMREMVDCLTESISFIDARRRRVTA